jgi:hypothetical protein
MDDDGREAGGHRQSDDIGRVCDAHQHEAAVQRRRDVVAVRGACADAFAFEGAGHQDVEWRIGAKQPVHGDRCGDGARGAATETAGKRQSFADREGDATALAESRQQRLRGDARGIPLRRPRQTSIVADDVVDRHLRRGPAVEARRDLVARRIEREPEHIEPARDVRHRRRREGGHSIHRTAILPDEWLATESQRHRAARRARSADVRFDGGPAEQALRRSIERRTRAAMLRVRFVCVARSTERAASRRRRIVSSVSLCLCGYLFW